MDDKVDKLMYPIATKMGDLNGILSLRLVQIENI